MALPVQPKPPITNSQVKQVLRKVLVSDYIPLIRSAFAEDLELLKTFDTNPALALDKAAASFISAIQPNDFFFKLENQYGTYVGFMTFGLPMSTMSFHIRKGPFRTTAYYQAFWALVNETFNNNIYCGIGSANLAQIPGILKATFEIKNQLQYHAKNFVLLRVNI